MRAESASWRLAAAAQEFIAGASRRDRKPLNVRRSPSRCSRSSATRARAISQYACDAEYRNAVAAVNRSISAATRESSSSRRRSSSRVA